METGTVLEIWNDVPIIIEWAKEQLGRRKYLEYEVHVCAFAKPLR